MRNLNIRKILLIAIIIFAAFVRFYDLSGNPPSLNWDEAALGYNAYSLSIDGHDEHGNFLPLSALESYGDFKAALYAYLTIIPVKIFGLNEFSIRFASAFFGTLSVFLTYFLVKEIFYNKKKVLKFELVDLALLSTFIFAISPWHIMLSRAAYEANVASFFMIGGLLFFLFGLNRKGYNFIISAVFFVLSLYTFHSERIVVPIFVLIISLFSIRELTKKKKYVILSAILGFILILPLIGYINSPQAKIRYQEVNIFSNIKIIEESNKKISENNNSFLARIIYNRRIGYGKEFIDHYIDHFSPDFLFISGDGNPRFSVRKVGQMYFWDIAFLLVGLAILIKTRPGKWYILPIWILIGIIPAALARETPHALRTESILPAPQIIVAYGFMSFYGFLKSRFKYAFPVGLFILLLLVVNFLYFMKILFYDYKISYAGEWQYGYKEVARYASSELKNYSKVYVDEEMGRPYIYNLIYNNISPSEFRKNAKVERDIFGFINVTSYGRIEYGRGIRSIYEREPENLYIKSFNDPKKVKDEIPNDAAIKRIIYLPNGNIMFIAFTKE